MTDELCVLDHRVDPDRPRRVAAGSLLCRGHISQGMTALERLPRNFADLATVAAPSGASSSGARSAETPIPYSERAANLRYGVKQEPEQPPRHDVELNGIRNTIIGWARTVADQRDVSLPARSEPQTQGPQCWQLLCPHQSCRRIAFEWQRATTFERRDDVDLACEFLRQHHDWSVRQDWAPIYAEELRDLDEAAWSVLHPTGSRRIICGPCVEVIEGERCEGTIIATVRDQADLLPSELWCDICGQSVPADKWLTYGRRVHGDGVDRLLAPGYAKLIRRIAG